MPTSQPPSNQGPSSSIRPPNFSTGGNRYPVQYTAPPINRSPLAPVTGQAGRDDINADYSAFAADNSGLTYEQLVQQPGFGNFESRLMDNFSTITDAPTLDTLIDQQYGRRHDPNWGPSAMRQVDALTGQRDSLRTNPSYGHIPGRATLAPPRYAPETQALKYAEGGLIQLAQQVSGQGRGGDQDLAYVTSDQMRMLKSMGGDGTINPQTGLPEYGLFKFIGKVFKSIGKVIKAVVKSPIGQILIPIALTMLAPGLGTALGMSMTAASSATFAGLVTGVGMTAANKIAGASWSDAIKGGVMSGAMAGVGRAMFPYVPAAGGTTPSGMTIGSVGPSGGPLAAGAPPLATPNIAGTGSLGPLSSIAGPQLTSAAPSTFANSAANIGAIAPPPVPGVPPPSLIPPGTFGPPAAGPAKPAFANSSATPAGQQFVPTAASNVQSAFVKPVTAYVPAPAPGAGVPVGPPTTETTTWQKLTNPLFFKDAPGVIGTLGRAVTSPLALAGLAATQLGRSGSANPSDYSKFINAQPEIDNQGYMDALNTRMVRDSYSPNITGAYGKGAEKLFFGNAQYVPKEKQEAAAGGRIGFNQGGLAQLGREFSGYTGAIPGAGGQDDVIEFSGPGPEGSALSPGEFVFDATTVADLGDGSSDEGARKLEKLREAIRRRKGRKHGGKIPPRAQGLNEMLGAVR